MPELAWFLLAMAFVLAVSQLAYDFHKWIESHTPVGYQDDDPAVPHKGEMT